MLAQLNADSYSYAILDEKYQSIVFAFRSGVDLFDGGPERPVNLSEMAWRGVKLSYFLHLADETNVLSRLRVCYWPAFSGFPALHKQLTIERLTSEALRKEKLVTGSAGIAQSWVFFDQQGVAQACAGYTAKKEKDCRYGQGFSVAKSHVSF